MTLSPAAEAAARAMTEDDLLAAVWGTPKRPGIARVRGWLGYHTHDSRRSDPGFPDLVLVRDGRLLFVELKREDGWPTGPQREWLAALRFATGDVHLWRPSDLIAGTVARALQ